MREFAPGIEAQRFAILRDRFGALALRFERSAQPFERIGTIGPIAALRRRADVVRQEAFGTGEIRALKKYCDAAKIIEARVRGINRGGALNGQFKIGGAARALKKAGDFKIGLNALRFLLQELAVDFFGLCRFFLDMKNIHGAREAAFDGIEKGNGFHLPARIVLVAAGNPGSVHFILGKIAVRGNVRGIEPHGSLKFFLDLAGEREAVLAVGFFAVGAAEPLMIERAFGLELNSALEGGNGGIEIEEFVGAASEPEMNLGIIGGFFERGLKCFRGGDVVAGVETFFGSAKVSGVIERGRLDAIRGGEGGAEKRGRAEEGREKESDSATSDDGPTRQAKWHALSSVNEPLRRLRRMPRQPNLIRSPFTVHPLRGTPTWRKKQRPPAFCKCGF
jgi:hypothetical protein